MRRQAGFTLLEIIIVLGLTLICLVPLGLLFEQGYRSFVALSLQTDLKFQSQRAAEAVFRRVAAQRTYRIQADHHGLSFPDGSSLRWSNSQLQLHDLSAPARNLLPGHRVLDFTVVSHGPRLVVNLSIEAQAHLRGRPLRWHEVYEYPRVALP